VADPHVVDALGYTQAARFFPSQVGPHEVPTPVPAQVGRVPCGPPMTAEHVPTCPPTSQAWHCPLHAESQQTPSMQNPEPHSLLEPHEVPFALVHLPGVPGRLQAKPVPVQAVSQHMPLTQLPL
jgi:hypothetical protein